MTLEYFLMVARTIIILSGVGFVFVLIRFSSRFPEVRTLALYFLLTLFAEVGSIALFSLKINPNYSTSVYNTLTYIPIFLIYYYAMDKKFGRPLLVVCLACSLATLLNLLFIQKSEINSYSRILHAITGISLGILYFYYLMKKLPYYQIQRLPMFWINSAFIIYYSGTLVLYLSTAYLVHVLNNNLLVYWTFHNVLAIIHNSLLIYAALVDYQNLRSGESFHVKF